ncbi:MAG: hypothetical protein HOE48_03395 [Candidatus Latescibacteria bacterium]|nr:hypothetical protein [Candidatus Latescibacterota bacterium]MBT4136930.1 hypothetical protein [Candidatus Latescibacterota bacterium]
MKLKSLYPVLFLLLGYPQISDAAKETIFGLEKVVITGVYDPNVRPERLLLVSGSLKLVGMGRDGNTWRTVTYIPQRPAAPRSDYGTFRRVGNVLIFYSYITFNQFIGTIQPKGERLLVDRFNARLGKRQQEVWYLVRGGQNL